MWIKISHQHPYRKKILSDENGDLQTIVGRDQFFKVLHVFHNE